MSDTDNATDRPFHVRTDPADGFVAGFLEEKAAQADAGRRNARAESIGIQTRYVVWARPS